MLFLNRIKLAGVDLTIPSSHFLIVKVICLPEYGGGLSWFMFGALTATQLAIKQYTPMKHLKISCQKHKIDSLLLSPGA